MAVPHPPPAGGINFKTDVQVKTYKDAYGTQAFLPFKPLF